MEKFRTKNLFLAGLLGLAMIFAVTFCFAACGGKELKPSDVTGEWYVETYVSSYNGNTDTSTFARFMELHNKADKTVDEEDEYVDLETVIYMWKAKEDGTLQCKPYFADEADYRSYGTWEVKDGKLNATITWFAQGDQTVEYKDGKITITNTRMWQDKPDTAIVTLAKVVK